MIRLLTKFRMCTFLALAAVFFAGSNAQAQIIVGELDGVVGQYTINSDGKTATIDLALATTTVINSSSSPMGVVWPTTFNNPVFTIDANTLTVTIPSAGTPLLNAKTIDTDNGGGFTDAVFTFQDATLSFPQANTLIINGGEILTQNTNDPGFDFSPFLAGGVFTFTLNAAQGTNIQSVIENGGTVIGTASFSQISVLIPEPASIIIWSVVGAAGVGGYFARRRKMKRAKV